MYLDSKCVSCNKEIELGSRLNHHIIDVNVFYGKQRYIFCNSCFSFIEEAIKPYISYHIKDDPETRSKEHLEKMRTAYK